MCDQTVKVMFRLLLEEQSDQGLHCLCLANTFKNIAWQVGLS